jgi:hypothetical protein
MSSSTRLALCAGGDRPANEGRSSVSSQSFTDSSLSELLFELAALESMSLLDQLESRGETIEGNPTYQGASQLVSYYLLWRRGDPNLEGLRGEILSRLESRRKAIELPDSAAA